jgi:DNA-binding transcriptional ArsR family regulator
MVKYSDDRLDQIFAALSDRTRRGILAQLNGKDSLSVSDLAAPFDMSLPAVMKHLDVLSDAGLVKRSKQGRTVACVLDARAMKAANDWLERYQRFWSASFDRLAKTLEDNQWLPQQPSSQASPSSAASKRRQRRSSKLGPTRPN